MTYEPRLLVQDCIKRLVRSSHIISRTNQTFGFHLRFRLRSGTWTGYKTHTTEWSDDGYSHTSISRFCGWKQPNNFLPPIEPADIVILFYDCCLLSYYYLLQLPLSPLQPFLFACIHRNAAERGCYFSPAGHYHQHPEWLDKGGHWASGPLIFTGLLDEQKAFYFVHRMTLGLPAVIFHHNYKNRKKGCSYYIVGSRFS